MDSNAWPAGTSLLHLYAQDMQHDPAAIVGTREGLEALRDAITRALDTGQPASAPAMTDDGEHYGAVVVPVTPAQMDGLPLPYTDTCIATAAMPRWLLDAIFHAAQAGAPT